MSGIQLSPEMAAKVAAIRAWDASVVEWIGLEPDYVVSVRTEQQLGGVLIEWEVLDSKEPPKPSRGSWRGWVRVESHGEGDALFTGRVALEQNEADDLAAAVGPKPSLFTREEAIRLQALTALEAERQESRP